MSNTLSGKVKLIPPGEVSSDRYQFLKLSEAEPNLGVSTNTGNILSTDSDGIRTWIGGAQAAGSIESGYIEYTNTGSENGKFNSSSNDPTGTYRLNYEGHFYATKIFGDASSLSNVFPDQTNNSGKFLTTDGTTPYWDNIRGKTIGISMIL